MLTVSAFLFYLYTMPLGGWSFRSGFDGIIMCLVYVWFDSFLPAARHGCFFSFSLLCSNFPITSSHGFGMNNPFFRLLLPTPLYIYLFSWYVNFSWYESNWYIFYSLFPATTQGCKKKHDLTCSIFFPTLFLVLAIVFLFSFLAFSFGIWWDLLNILCVVCDWGRKNEVSDWKSWFQLFW